MAALGIERVWDEKYVPKVKKHQPRQQIQQKAKEPDPKKQRELD